MKKFLSTVLALVFVFLCVTPASATDTFEDKDKVVGITFDSPFGEQPIRVYFGYNKYIDELSDLIPRFEINNFSDTDVWFWVKEEIYDIGLITAHYLQRFLYGSKTLTDKATGVTVSFSNKRFGERTNEVSLVVEELTYDEFLSYNEPTPLFTIGMANETVDGNRNILHYAVKIVDADGNLALADLGEQTHQMYWTFTLPQKHPIDFYEISYWYPSDTLARSGEFSYNIPINNTVSYMLYEFY